jgi:hypothetical protein
MPPAADDARAGALYRAFRPGRVEAGSAFLLDSMAWSFNPSESMKAMHP